MLSALLLLAVQSTPAPVRAIAVPYPPGVPISGPHAPGTPHILYLNFDGATLTRGNCSNAPTNSTDIQYPVVSGVESGFLNMDMLICDYGPNWPTCGPPSGQPTSDCTGTGHQNSFQFLIDDMGPNPNQGPDMMPPTISFTTP